MYIDTWDKVAGTGGGIGANAERMDLRGTDRACIFATCSGEPVSLCMKGVRRCNIDAALAAEGGVDTPPIW